MGRNALFSLKDKKIDDEEENYQSEGGSTEERNIWYLTGYGSMHDLVNF